jgi:hypothetical protein
MAKPGLHLTKNCARCKSEYRQSRSDQQYCTRKCGLAAWREENRAPSLGEKKCDVCGRLFQLKTAKGRYCSKACLSSANAATKKRTGGPGKGWSKGVKYVPRTPCQLCGKMFYAPPVQRRRGGGKFCSNRCRVSDMAAKPARYPQVRTRRSNGGRRTDLKDQYFRSSWEANYARYLNWLIANGQIKCWEFEPDTFEFPVKRGSRFYTPDFKITNNDASMEYHEIKGYMDQRSATKLKRMAKYYPLFKIVLIDKHQYRAIAKTMAHLLPSWENARGKQVYRED